MPNAENGKGQKGRRAKGKGQRPYGKAGKDSSKSERFVPRPDTFAVAWFRQPLLTVRQSASYTVNGGWQWARSHGCRSSRSSSWSMQPLRAALVPAIILNVFC